MRKIKNKKNIKKNPNHDFDKINKILKINLVNSENLMKIVVRIIKSVSLHFN